MLSPAYCPVLVTFHHSCLSLCLPDHLSGWLPQFTGDSFTVRQSPLSEAYTVSQPWDGWIQWLQQAQIIIIIILIDSHFISIITNYTVSANGPRQHAQPYQETTGLQRFDDSVGLPKYLSFSPSTATQPVMHGSQPNWTHSSKRRHDAVQYSLTVRRYCLDIPCT